MKTATIGGTAALLALVWGTAGCSGHGSSAASAADAGYPGEDLGLPPVADGFVRYETPPLTVAAGQDILWEDWVGAPLENDMDVVAVTGAQSAGGHHALLYATTNVQPVGTSHVWAEADQLTAQTVGAVGGEGITTSGTDLPAGVVFRLTKGRAMMIQSHYINATAEAIQGRSVIDVKLGPVDPNATVASLFASTTLNISIPPGERTSIEISCPVQHDLQVLMYANHMHNLGVSATTELVAPDGGTTPLKDDPVWDPSWAFHPNYTTFSLQSPAVIPAGSTVHTTCTWSNTAGAGTVSFPDEMCVFTSFYLGASDISCIDGNWQE